MDVPPPESAVLPSVLDNEPKERKGHLPLCEDSQKGEPYNSTHPTSRRCWRGRRNGRGRDDASSQRHDAVLQPRLSRRECLLQERMLAFGFQKTLTERWAHDHRCRGLFSGHWPNSPHARAVDSWRSPLHTTVAKRVGIQHRSAQALCPVRELALG